MREALEKIKAGELRIQLLLVPTCLRMHKQRPLYKQAQ